MGVCNVAVGLLAGSLNLIEIVRMQGETVFYGVTFAPLLVIYFIALLAETNRAPFDLPESEAELVAGYNIEYAAMGFALFFLGEYCSMILMSSVIVLLFLGGWLDFYGILHGLTVIIWPLNLLFFCPEFIFGVKTMVITVLFVLVRASLPRYRYDQLMS